MALFEQKVKHIPSNLLKDKYGWPPFSVLHTLSFDWQRRRDEWEVIVGDSTEGRDVRRYNATPTNTFSARGASAKQAESVSEFDPYLCELMYRWFSLPDFSVLDPFAGGWTRGLVATVLDRKYYGIDLSEIQVKSNEAKLADFYSKYTPTKYRPEYFCKNSADFLQKFDKEVDMVFTCPPYYNLEKYSKDPLDISNAPTYEDFLKIYSDILYLSSTHLKNDSFFVIVTSEVRSNAFVIAESNYVGLVPDTISILRDRCNLYYYNEIILENNIGSLPIRAPKYFRRTRKIGRHHQNILVFYKGDLTHIEDKFNSEII